jgi:hypothetical protein
MSAAMVSPLEASIAIRLAAVIGGAPAGSNFETSRFSSQP